MEQRLVFVFISELILLSLKITHQAGANHQLARSLRINKNLWRVLVQRLEDLHFDRRSCSHHSTSDTTQVAQEVVKLFTTGSQGQNTVLLLLKDEQLPDTLEDSIRMTIKEQKIVTHKPVAVLLCCVRKDISEKVFLKHELSENEQQKFDEKKKELLEKYGRTTHQFHGFNIMQTNFSKEYIQEACKEFRSDSEAQRPLNGQLAAFLSLLNAYAPGSYLLKSQCLDFLQCSNNPFEEKMEPFNHLIVIFQEDERAEKKVRMAHPLIAKCCTELLADGGVTRSDTTKNLLNNFYRNKDQGEFPHYLLWFIKDMLTKREFKTKLDETSGLEVKGDKERFSKLILDIKGKENKFQSASVLEEASNTFVKDPFFPQALARFYYIELNSEPDCYSQAERWAETAKKRDPQNSFIADTLGQVHKNHLNKTGKHLTSEEILAIATKAIQAFKDEERLAEEQHPTDMSDKRAARISHLFNCRGQFGFLQVCNILYDFLPKKSQSWKSVLTKNTSFRSVLEKLGGNNLDNFNDLVSSLKGEVEKKAEFFAEYLTYSKPKVERDDLSYMSEETSKCQKNFVGDLQSTDVNSNEKCMHELQRNLAGTSAGVLACMDRKYCKDQLETITRCWKEICFNPNSESGPVNHILAHVLSLNLGATIPDSPEASIQSLKERKLNDNDRPELHLLSLLLHWPTNDKDKGIFDLSQQVQEMRSSYDRAYLKYFRSRYLQPLFFIGKGKDLDRLVHRRILEQLFLDQSQMDPDCFIDWKTEDIFKNEKVKERLLKVQGVVRNYSVFLTSDGQQIEIEANMPRSLWKPQEVSFFLGFTIRGPVAFDIKKSDRDLDSKEAA